MSRALFSPPEVAREGSEVEPGLFRRPLTEQRVRTPFGGPLPADDAAPVEDAAANEATDGDHALLEAALEQAQQKGYEDGLALGRAEGKGELQDAITRWSASADQLDGMYASLCEAYRQEFLELCLGISKALCRREVRADSHAILREWMEHALEQLGRPGPVEVRLSAADAETLQPWLEARAHTGVTLLVDEELEPGDFRVRSDRGSVESLLEHRIERVRALVRGELGAGTETPDPPTANPAAGEDEGNGP